ncbi:ABC1 family protein YPL109C, mitochondrial [Ceratocystis fimbriata CBS 114723]|uniref:ABC1 family protein YPL109C, mitochondrial n=1 Tax=Ceratocystis fimbriata CBS 114723 TaxID=1035309 RepID=A0A2C5WYV8_9PEZI|nr:ABC1 family protein YPL109C, mitochondrial [Ceratocystis fimbriata CBS 114723]
MSLTVRCARPCGQLHRIAPSLSPLLPRSLLLNLQQSARLRARRLHSFAGLSHGSNQRYHKERQIKYLKAGAGAAAVAGGLALGFGASDVDSSTNNKKDRTPTETLMLASSQEEMDKRLPKATSSLTRLRCKVVYFLDTWIWEPFCTCVRFVHLFGIFMPVIICVPAIWMGPRVAKQDNERSGTLWWYGFLVQSMEWAGPTFIKLGQWAASRSDIFPDEMCNIMSKLHSNAPAHSLAETKHIISEAFHGLPFDDIFEEFETTPMGVGAIAQVYKAKLRPGLTVPEAKGPASAFQLLRETVLRNIDIILKSSPKGVPSSYVAVKVVHPGIDRTIRRDLRIMTFFAQVLNAIPSIEWLSLPDEVAQFGEMMHLQLDLRIEATNLARFRYNFKDRTTVSFPHAYPQFTTKKMLIEEFAQGIPLADFLELGGGVYQQDIANEGLDAFLRMLLLDNFVHADLHPGNIMVRFYPAELPKWSKSEGSNQEWPDTETEKILSRLRPFAASKNREGWVRELENIEREGYHAQLIFIDTGLVTELNAVNRRNFLDLFRAIAEFSGYRAGELMCDRCRQPDAVIGKEYFALKMQRLVNNVKSRTLALGSIKIGDILQNVLGMVREHHVRMEGDFVNVVISILLLEGIGRTLDPDLDLLSSALPILRQVSAQSGAEMAKQGDFSVLLMWVGLETRRFLQASVDDVESCVKYDLLSPNV